MNWRQYAQAEHWHPAANLFPLLPADQELKELADDISKNGLLNPIVLLDGLVLDGRNRLLACRLVGVEPTFVPWKPNGRISAIAWVISQNAKRRHLTPSQKAFVAVEAEKLLAVEAKRRQLAAQNNERGRAVRAKMPEQDKGRARDEAAKLIGVSPRYVQDAKKISAAAPGLAAEIRAGKLDITQANRQIKEEARQKRREENRKVIESAPPATAINNARFATIMIDPPWDYREEGEVGNVFGRAFVDYATMPIENLLELPVAKLADVDCHLYLWITNRSLPKGFRLIEKWGFRYVTCLTWCKPIFGMGNYFRGQTEQMLFAVKGSQPLLRKDVGTWFQAPRGKGGHSSKPEKAYELVENCSPGPYLEMFSRSSRTGWTHWGAAGVREPDAS